MARVLIAEDDEAVRAFTVRALEFDAHEVEAVEHGGAALQALERAAFDLLLTDIVMPHVDGIALALAAARDYPDLRILMMTGFAHERQKAHNLDDLVHRVVAKPFTLDEIRAAVQEALAA